MALLQSLLRRAPQVPSMLARPLHRTCTPVRLSGLTQYGRPTAPASAPAPPSVTRFVSTAALHARQKTQLYPPVINVYRAGTTATVAVGITRLSTLVIFLIGAGIYAPAFYHSADHSNWLIPVLVVASAVPAVVVALATGPMVHGIRVWLPEKVRRGGKDALRKFSASTPGDTQVEIQFMRWKPWPQAKTITFSRFRRLQPSLRRGISNLEYVAKGPNNERKVHPLLDQLARRGVAQYYVNRNQKADRAAVPGVWDGMWHQIPWAGEGRAEVKKSSGTSRVLLKPVAPPLAAVGRP